MLWRVKSEKKRKRRRENKFLRLTCPFIMFKHYECSFSIKNIFIANSNMEKVFATFSHFIEQTLLRKISLSFAS